MVPRWPSARKLKGSKLALVCAARMRIWVYVHLEIWNEALGSSYCLVVSIVNDVLAKQHVLCMSFFTMSLMAGWNTQH